jgi:predicted MFS family arabinose efflux permease
MTTAMADSLTKRGWPVDVPRPRLVSRELLLVFAAELGAATSFYLLLTAVPMYAICATTGALGPGSATAAVMFSTVAAELATPRLVARSGFRWAFAAGLFLLGAPALALTGSASTAVILAVCIIRGIGFGITVVVGGALVAALVPHQRRGEGLGLYGAVVGVPAVVALPLGVWLSAAVGYGPVFIAGAIASLVVLAVVRGLPGREPDQERPVTVLAGLRTPALVRPALVFSATTVAAGIVVTFLPLAVSQASGSLAALGLLVQAAAATGTRWWAGRYGDRHGSAGLLIPGLLAAAAGMLALAVAASPALVVAGMGLFGAGFGITQNASLALMYERVSTSGFSAVSAVWNLAYDAGYGVGAFGFGLVAVQTGYATAFVLTAGAMLVALAPAWRDRRASLPSDGMA